MKLFFIIFIEWWKGRDTKREGEKEREGITKKERGRKEEAERRSKFDRGRE